MVLRTKPFSLPLKLIKLNSEYFYLLKEEQGRSMSRVRKKRKRRTKSEKCYRGTILVTVTFELLIMPHNKSKGDTLQYFWCFPFNSDCGIFISKFDFWKHVHGTIIKQNKITQFNCRNLRYMKQLRYLFIYFHIKIQLFSGKEQRDTTQGVFHYYFIRYLL